jgi:DNA-binding MarR family transcriptional regulator
MDSVSHETLLKEAPRRLAELLAIPTDGLKVDHEVNVQNGHVDLTIRSGNQVFVVECKSTGQAASVAMAARQARGFAKAWRKAAIPLVVVPFMGEVGRQLCEEEGVSWFDLSGNAHLVAPGLRVQIEGKPNRFKRVGRPKSLFAPKSARITRWLLMKSDHAFTQRELARTSGLDEGFTSRIVRGLEEERLVERSPNGTIRTTNYDTLLEAWREVYDFSKHEVIRGHMAARSNDDVLKRLADQLQRNEIKYAATGLAGAWLYSGFTGFRLVVLYVAEMPDDAVRGQLGFEEVQRGENVWLVRPDDDGVFQGGELRHNIACVHPVQVYLDLKDHPERATQAAEELRKKLLNPPAHV